MRGLLTVFALFLFLQAMAQESGSFKETDSVSLSLYTKSAWKELLQYGKKAVAQGQDFSLLRQRMGYAAFMTGNYSAAIDNYERVVKEDRFNGTAHYFIYWSRQGLNQPEQARAEIKFMNDPAIPLSQKKKAMLTETGIEYSHKSTTIAERGTAGYSRILLGVRLGELFMDQSVAYYGQKISEPLLTTVNNNDKIAIHQGEYYNRVHINLDRHWQLKAAWHYLYTPFNNFKYNNNLLLAGLKFNSSYFTLQADIISGKLTDTSQQQYDLQLGLYPLGNLKLYGFSTAMLVQRGKSSFSFKQVLGIQFSRNGWLEGNITAGAFHHLAENDALYVYHAIDPNTMKAGLSVYYLVHPVLLQLGYTTEKRNQYTRTTIFNQHSITGGIIWKL